jgi:hypothetical protein
MKGGTYELRRNIMLGLAGHAVGNWLFFAAGISPAAVLAGITSTWMAVRSSLGRPAQWLTARSTTLNRYLLAMIVVIAAAGLAGCAGHAERHVQFFKAYGPGQVEQRYLGMNILTVSETDRAPSLPK